MIITLLIAKIILGGYWLMLAPVLFLPLGAILLSPQVLRRILGALVLLLSTLFAAVGVIFLLTLFLPDAVGMLTAILGIWCLAAAITFVAPQNNAVARLESFGQARS